MVGTWNHVTDDVILHVDGHVVASSQSSPMTTLSQDGDNMFIGKAAYGRDLNTVDLVVDEWYFWDSILSRDQVMEVYMAYPPGISHV